MTVCWILYPNSVSLFIEFAGTIFGRTNDHRRATTAEWPLKMKTCDRIIALNWLKAWLKFDVIWMTTLLPLEFAKVSQIPFVFALGNFFYLFWFHHPFIMLWCFIVVAIFPTNLNKTVHSINVLQLNVLCGQKNVSNVEPWLLYKVGTLHFDFFAFCDEVTLVLLKTQGQMSD